MVIRFIQYVRSSIPPLITAHICIWFSLLFLVHSIHYIFTCGIGIVSITLVTLKLVCPYRKSIRPNVIQYVRSQNEISISFFLFIQIELIAFVVSNFSQHHHIQTIKGQSLDYPKTATATPLTPLINENNQQHTSEFIEFSNEKNE